MTRIDNEIVFVTHSGSFHADDVFAYAVLSDIFPKHQLIRSRNPKDWAKGDIVFDVGGGVFDHHHVEKKHRENGIPYASFGLIWEQNGIEYLTSFCDESELQEIFVKIDESFIQAVDALDNGFNLVRDRRVKVNSVSDIIASFNNLVDINEYETVMELETEQDARFVEATNFAKIMLRNEVIGLRNAIRAKESVKKAFDTRTDSRLIILEKDCPWEEALLENDKEQEVLFVVYPKSDGYYIQVVRKGNDTFEARKDLPKSWAGLREDLGEVVGIHDAIFCHPALFLAGAKSKESILKMAEQALIE